MATPSRILNPFPVNSLLNYGITSSEEIQEMQKVANAQADQAVRESSVASMTYSSAVKDAYDALAGITADLVAPSTDSPRKALGDILGHGNRLRGIGLICIAVALIGSLADYMLLATP
jgi:hypothetical protein